MPEETPSQSDFLLTIKIPFKSFDAVDARINAKQIMRHTVGFFPSLDDAGVKVKLQQIFPDKEPTGIQL